MSARWWKPWTWGRAAGVRRLTDLVDGELWATDQRKAVLEAAVLAQRAGLVFAPGALEVAEVEALAQAREQLELERAAVLEGLLRDFKAAIVAGATPAGDPQVERLMRASARKGAA